MFTGIDPVALLRWSIIRTLMRSVFAFSAAGDKYRNSNSKSNYSGLFYIITKFNMCV